MTRQIGRDWMGLLGIEKTYNRLSGRKHPLQAAGGASVYINET
jgi:hypothetical protein